MSQRQGRDDYSRGPRGGGGQGRYGSSGRNHPQQDQRQQGGYPNQGQTRQGQYFAQQQQGQGAHAYGQQQAAAGGNYQQQQQQFAQQYPQQYHAGSGFPAQAGGNYNPHAAAAAGWAGAGQGAQQGGRNDRSQSRGQYDDRGRGDGYQQSSRGGRGAAYSDRRDYGDRDRRHGGQRDRDPGGRDRSYGGHGIERGGFEAGRGPGRGPSSDRMSSDRGRAEPYSLSNRPQHGSGGGQLVDVPTAQHWMRQQLADMPHHYQQDWTMAPSFSGLPTLRSQHGKVGAEVKLLVNMFPLMVTGEQLLHYDMEFERVGKKTRKSAADAPAGLEDPEPMATCNSQGSGTSGTAAAARRAAQGPRGPKPPDNVREILQRFEEQYWSDCQPRVIYGTDNAKNLFTVSKPPLFSDRVDEAKIFQVDGVMMLGRDGLVKPSSWKITFKLTKPPMKLPSMRLYGKLLQEAMQSADKGEVDMTWQWFLERRQPLEWILKEIIMARTGGIHGIRGAMTQINEVGRNLYFENNPANRNIGGGLKALTGLKSSVKLVEGGVMFTADITSSAFLRTDINLVQWMADVLGFNVKENGGGGRGFGRGGGRGGRGRGGGRSVDPVTAPDVDAFLHAWGHDRRLRSKVILKLRNKKVVYHSPDNKTYKYQAAGLSDESADQAYFELRNKDGTVAGQVSVAQYYAQHLRYNLKYAQLPVVAMKVPKNCKMDKIWVPPELLSFEKNQRVQNVSHKGGTEQMIAAARKDPSELAAAIKDAVNPRAARDSRDAATLEREFGVKLGNMHQVTGRILPGPWLLYQYGAGQGLGQMKALNTGTAGSWNMQGGYKFSDPAALKSWGILAACPDRTLRAPAPFGIASWMHDMVTRMKDLGMDLDSSMSTEELVDTLLDQMVVVPESANLLQLQQALTTVKHRAAQKFGRDCELVLCFIQSKPSAIYRDIKLAAELGPTVEEELANIKALGLVTQVIVAERTDLGPPRGSGPSAAFKPNRRSQYQANVCMKINAKLGGINTRWALQVHDFLRHYFSQDQVPSLMVFGIDLTHPGKVEGGRSIAAVVGSLDTELCRYGHQVWEEPNAGSEAMSREKLVPAVKELLEQHYSCTGRRPGCLIFYRDGVSDAELEFVKELELQSVAEACRSLKEADGRPYQPRLVYIVVQKRHNVRLLKGDSESRVQNLDPGTVVDHTIVSPKFFDFYLNSHAALIGTSRAARYICLLDDLGFGADGLQTFTYWLCYLYCRCARSVSVVAPVYYAHLLAFRARMLQDDGSDDMISLRTGSSGASNTNMRQLHSYAEELNKKMFFV